MNTNTTLMLLAMAAGAMMLAGDAYAQTYKDNTERIKALLENTGDIKTMLGNLTGSISSITDPLTDQIESILLSIASVNNEVADVKSSISTFASSFLTIQATVGDQQPFAERHSGAAGGHGPQYRGDAERAGQPG